MNAKPNPSMSSKRLLLLLGAVLCAQISLAQSPWRQGRNIAGVARTSSDVGQDASAELGGRFTSGEFRSPSDGQTLWTGEAQAEAEARFPDLLLQGNFGFTLTQGTGMMGSMFTEPGYYPIDVLEFTPGTKVRQSYDIGGGLAWKNDSPWTPGGTVRFRGVNYAKRKDLRHTTYRQEIEVVPSLSYQGDGWMAGLSYIFEKTSEFITAEQVGQAKAESYYAFLDKGLRYGTQQVWDGSGIHLKEAGVDRLPVKEITHGVAVQASLGTCLYADVEYAFSQGLVGEKGYNWFRFPGRRLEAKVIAALPGDAGKHLLRADFEWTRQDNYETVVEKDNHNGVTTPHEYGSNNIFQKRTLSMGPSYSFAHGKGWQVATSLTLQNDRARSTMMYPYVDYDASTHLRWNVRAVVPLGRFTLLAGGMAGCKVGEHQHSFNYDNTELDVKSIPERLTSWYERETEATDATRISLSLALRYNFHIGPQWPLYVEAGCRWLHAFNIQLLPGCDRQTTHLTLGYNF